MWRCVGSSLIGLVGMARGKAAGIFELRYVTITVEESYIKRNSLIKSVLT